MKKSKKLLLLLFTFVMASIFPLQVQATPTKDINLSKMILVNKTIEPINDEYHAEIEDYIVENTETRAYSTKEATRTYTIKGNSSGEIFVKFTLYGKFQYDASTSSGTCIDAYVNVTNNKPSRFTILNQSAVEAGDTAMGYCYAYDTSYNEYFGRTLKIRINEGGVISYPD